MIVIGGHSDSVHAGPGINDNGSGTAALLEISHLFRNVEPVNAVRFCWWTAEGIQFLGSIALIMLLMFGSLLEFGLLGAKHHVENLSTEEKKKIALYLNFDMIASPNAINGIYDGRYQCTVYFFGNVPIDALSR